jgi:hypothetical protein
VRDGVVQLARESRTCVGDGPGGAGLRGARHLLGGRVPAARDAPHGEHARGEHGHGQRLGRRVAARAAFPGDADGERQDPERDRRITPRRGGAERVRADDRGIDLERRAGERPGPERPEYDERDARRGPPSRGERERHERHRGDVQRGRPLHHVLAQGRPEHLHHADGEQSERNRRVERVNREPSHVRPR